jgi:hypothetical protein
MFRQGRFLKKKLTDPGASAVPARAIALSNPTPHCTGPLSSAPVAPSYKPKPTQRRADFARMIAAPRACGRLRTWRAGRTECGANADGAGPVAGSDGDFTGEADARGEFADDVDYLCQWVAAALMREWRHQTRRSPACRPGPDGHFPTRYRQGSGRPARVGNR